MILPVLDEFYVNSVQNGGLSRLTNCRTWKDGYFRMGGRRHCLLYAPLLSFRKKFETSHNSNRADGLKLWTPYFEDKFNIGVISFFK